MVDQATGGANEYSGEKSRENLTPSVLRNQWRYAFHQKFPDKRYVLAGAVARNYS